METPHRPTILIADDHKLVAEACKSLLEPEFDVIALVTDGRASVQATEELRPEVVILDISMPELNGLDAGEQIKHKNRYTKLVYLTMASGLELVAEAFRRGASGYVLKQDGADELLSAVRCVLHGQSYLSPLITKDTFDFLVTSDARYMESRLSDRMRGVLQLLAEGRSMKQIAHLLHVKPKSVVAYRRRIMDTLGIKSDPALVQYAHRHHMISHRSKSSFKSKQTSRPE